MTPSVVSININIKMQQIAFKFADTALIRNYIVQSDTRLWKQTGG